MRPPGSPFARSTRRSLLATTALAGLVATAACGTTVPLASQSALGSGDGLSSADPDERLLAELQVRLLAE